MKFLLFIFLIILLCLSFSSFAQEKTSEWKLYTQALEAIINNHPEEAISYLEKLLEKYPDSQLATRAQLYLSQLKNRIDHSGIVSYYTSQMISSVYVTTGIPGLFNFTDPLTIGLTGIGGVGLGIWTAWLTSQENNLSIAHELWIEGSMGLLLANYNLLGIILENKGEFFASKWYPAIQIGLITGHRILSYLWLKNTPYPSYGKPPFVFWLYSWAQFYSWASILAFTNSDPTKVIPLSLSMILANGAACAGYFLWDHFPMTLERSGLISLSGLGGAGVGFFGLMIATSIFDNLNSHVPPIVLMLSALSGKVIGYLLTENMPLEKRSKPEVEKLSLNLIPYISKSSLGIGCRIAY